MNSYSPTSQRSVLLMALCMLAAPSSAAPLRPPAININNGDTGFIALSDMTQSTGKPKMGNGVVVNTKLWPASFVSSSAQGSCTATLIGPRVLMTAAHCVGQGKMARITYADGQVFDGVCKRFPQWSAHSPSADFALCHMQAVVKKSGLQYEYISLDPVRITKGLQLLAGGYGCTDLESQTVENPPEFRIGSLFIDKLPTVMPAWPEWIATTPGTPGEAAFVCPGDSGGAVYAVKENGARAAVALISAVGADKSQNDYLVSYLAALSSAAGKKFVTDWLAETNERVCGVGSAPSDCREH
jgi:hypothetical protein